MKHDFNHAVLIQFENIFSQTWLSLKSRNRLILTDKEILDFGGGISLLALPWPNSQVCNTGGYLRNAG